jgi:hypothetical protein
MFVTEQRSSRMGVLAPTEALMNTEEKKDPNKLRTIELGETAGEECVLRILGTQDGLQKLAGTLAPGEHEAWGKEFYAHFAGGAEPWDQYARENKLAQSSGAHEDWYRAFYAVFARGARRSAEAAVSGYLDAISGKPADVQNVLRRYQGSVRKRVVDAYMGGHSIGSLSRGTEPSNG